MTMCRHGSKSERMVRLAVDQKGESDGAGRLAGAAVRVLLRVAVLLLRLACECKSSAGQHARF